MPGALLLEQETIESVVQVRACRRLCRQAELARDRLEQFDPRPDRVEEKGHLGLAAKPLQQRPAERRLAGADFTRDGDESLAFLDSVE